MGRHMNTVEHPPIWDRHEAPRDFHGDSGVGRAAVEHGAGLCGPPAAWRHPGQ